MQGTVAAHAGARPVAYLVAGRRGAVQHGQRSTRVGDGVRAVQGFVDVQGGGQTGWTFGQFSVIAGRESTIAAELCAHADLAGPEQGRKVSARGEGWRRVVELVRTGTADVVVARHYDRLYRTTRDLVELVDLAEETGVHLAAAQAQGVLDLATPSGRLAAHIGAAVAENETEMRVERQELGHQRRRESGRPFWSTRPFGFERDGTHREEEAEALRQAYRDVLAGVSLWSIAKVWNARELLSPHGREWRSSNLRGVLLKPRNAGIQTYSQWVEKPDGRRVRVTEEIGTGNWEPIVSEGMFRALVRYLSATRAAEGSARLCCPAWSAARSVRPS